MRFAPRYLVAGLAVCLCMCFVLLQLTGNTQFDDPYEQAMVKKQIIQLSQKYVDGLAAEHRQLDVKDGPFAVVKTSFGWPLVHLKKTLAILLQSYNERLERIEAALAINREHTHGHKADEAAAVAPGDQAVNIPPIPEDLQLKAVINEEQDDCVLPSNWASQFPQCENKIEWMSSFWQTDPCYAENGVDGSRGIMPSASCKHFLLCIRISEAVQNFSAHVWHRIRRCDTPTPCRLTFQAQPKFDVDGLFALMNDVPGNYAWIKNRVRQMWPKWKAAFEFLMQKQAWTFDDRPRKRILLHMGFLSSDTGLKFSENSAKGGPLGELVQWSDLIAVCYLLGHELVISSDTQTFVGLVKADPALKSSCPLRDSQKKQRFDLIFIDIMGLRQMRRKVPGGIDHYRCRLRVLDSFGTQAEFNEPNYYVQHKTQLGGHKNYWGGHKLQLQQFYTLFPHSADNTFLGFVVDMHQQKAGVTEAARENIALVYGKQAYMWQNHSTYLDTIHSVVPVHATVDVADPKFSHAVPSYVINHGVMGGAEFHSLLRRVKIFVGLGFPYEGPAPLEAIANGAIFINPRYSQPKSRLTEPFFREKPTLRALSSQSPYAEQFMGAPYVHTVDMHNKEQVLMAVKTALQSEAVKFVLQSKPQLSFELTPPGMLERVNALLEHQDLCNPAHNWPPFSAATLLNTTQSAQSCQQRCAQQNLYCERSYFAKINANETMKRFGTCTEVSLVSETYAPAITTAPDGSAMGVCHLQHDELLFSCSTPAPDGWTRICPCRDAIREQVQLCAACL